MTFGFIGLGNMASAIIGGMIKKGVAEQSTLWGSDKTEKALATAQEKFGMHVTLDNCEVARNADILFLAVKPGFLGEVIDQIKDVVTEEMLIVSIAAGKTNPGIFPWMIFICIIEDFSIRIYQKSITCL